MLRNRIILDAMEYGCCCKCIYSQTDGDNTLELYMWSVGTNPYVELVWTDSSQMSSIYQESCHFLDNGDCYYSANPEIFTGNCTITMTIHWDGGQSDPLTFNCINLKPDTNFTVTRTDVNTFQVASADDSEIPIATKISTGIVQIGDGIDVDENGVISTNGIAEKLQTSGSSYYVTTSSENGVVISNGDAEIRVKAVGSGFGAGFEITDQYGWCKINVSSEGPDYKTANISLQVGPMQISLSGSNGVSIANFAANDTITMSNNELSVRLDDGTGQLILSPSRMRVQAGDGVLSMGTDGLRFNDKKVLTE